MLKKRLVFLSVLALAILLVYMFTMVGSRFDYVLPRRALKIAAMVLIACSVGYSAVVFQTITNNRILTPSIMGFESVYVLFQTLLVFLYGDASFQVIHSHKNFVFSVILMLGFALLLYYTIFRKDNINVYFLLLVGLILGTIFRSMTSFMQMIIDPNEFAIIQKSLFASFNNIHTELLGISAITLIITLLIGSRLLNVLDVVSLGKEHAIS